MPLKDYFALLELEASASQAEIKKAYRRLALQLHPDKAGSDPWSAARFAEVKEAYEVLTDPTKREYYLQQRWYQQSQGRKKMQEIIHPASMIGACLELERHVARLDHFRLDRQGLLAYMLSLFSDDNIQKLLAFNDPESTRSIVRSGLHSLKPLEPTQASELVKQLDKLAAGYPALQQEIRDSLQEVHRYSRKEKWNLLLVTVLTLLICMLLYLLGR